MSAVEIIAAIEKLPDEEREKVSNFVRKLDAGKEATQNNPVSAEFKALADEVFTTNAELFRKLAK